VNSSALSLSVVVVAYDMAREVPRTLRSLAPAYQRGMTADEYEVILVDNGSPEPLDVATLDSFGGRLRSFAHDIVMQCFHGPTEHDGGRWKTWIITY